MKDSTTGEISNLFQELIVSKIKDEIDVLKGEIDEIKESSGICEEKVEKLPKSSSIRQIVEGEQTKVLDLINNLAKDSKSEKYLRDIVAYLKKQYSFSEERTLCLVLDEMQRKENDIFDEILPIKSFTETNNIEKNLNLLIEYVTKQFYFDNDKYLCDFLKQFSEETKDKIAYVIDTQESFVDKYDSIIKILNQYKDCILTSIHANNECLESISEQLRETQRAIKNNGDSIETIIDKSRDDEDKLSSIQDLLGNILKNTENSSALLDKVIQDVGSKSEIVESLHFLNSSIYGEKINAEVEWSVKNSLVEVNKNIGELAIKSEHLDGIICAYNEKYECLEKNKKMLFIFLAVGNFVSAIGVIILLLLQIF